jgi:hypothetical protein
MRTHDNVVSVQANLSQQRQVEASLRGRPEPKPGRRAFLDHHDDVGAGGIVDVEAALTGYHG